MFRIQEPQSPGAKSLELMTSAVLRIALDMPLRRLFDYLPPANAASGGEPGQRVRVPFGRQRLVGLVMEQARFLGPARRAPEVRAGGAGCRAGAGPVGARAAALGRRLLPPPHRRSHRRGHAEGAARRRARRWLSKSAGLRRPRAPKPAPSGEPRRAAKQRELLAHVVERNGALCRGAGAVHGGLAERRPRAGEARLDRLERAAGRARELRRRQPPGGPTSASTTGARTLELAPEQHEAVERVSESLGKFGAFVLYGITGSGKTEVYLRIVDRVLARGERALVLVPEIGLTPQLVERFRERFTVPLAVLHSALTDNERLQAWRSSVQRPRAHRARHALRSVRAGAAISA